VVDPSTALAAFVWLGGATPDSEVRLDAPRHRPTPPLRLRAPLPAPDDGPADRRRVFVEVVDFDAPVHASARRDTWGLGTLRRGTILPARRGYPASGCSGWAALPDGGGVCDGDGVTLVGEPGAPGALTLEPDLGEALPYRYAKVVAPGTPRLARLPTPAELLELRAGELPTGLPHVRTEGVVFVALDKPYAVDGEVFVRTLEGDYIAHDQLVPVTPPVTMGQPLVEATLPVAFVVADDAPLFSRGEADDTGKAGDTLIVAGIAERTARFPVTAQPSIGDQPYLEGPGGRLVRRADARLAQARRRPSGVGPHEKWIHVDLDEQVLVAYEGDRPVFVTLVSTGKAGYDTPAGHYRLRRKFVSRRMTGPDPDTGTYDIAEVPWAMYYKGGYALHGAYWHDEFGQVRSHGCTNLPPPAARWLFRWSAPEIPTGWHARFEAGTRIVFTRH